MSVSTGPSPRILQLPLSSASSPNPLILLGAPSNQCRHPPLSHLASYLPCQSPAPSILPPNSLALFLPLHSTAPTPAQAWASPCILPLLLPCSQPLCSPAPQLQVQTLNSLVSLTPLTPSSLLQEMFVTCPQILMMAQTPPVLSTFVPTVLFHHPTPMPLPCLGGLLPFPSREPYSSLKNQHQCPLLQEAFPDALREEPTSFSSGSS